MNASVDGNGLSVIVLLDGDVVFALTVDAEDDDGPVVMDIVIHPDVEPDTIGKALALADDQLKHVKMMKRVRGLSELEMKKQQFNNAAAFTPNDSSSEG